MVRALLAIVVAYRLAYHASFLGDVPFALGTFSDGSMYEEAARNIVEFPPWGTEPFYLQGAYSYLLALPMFIKPWIALGLVMQLSVAAATWWLFHRASVRLWGKHMGRACSLVFLLVPAVAFYENKFLTASMTVAASVLVFDAFVAWHAGGKRRHLIYLGAALGLGILMRPNFVLVVPFAVLAVALTRRSSEHPRFLAPSVVGVAVVLALVPMALRNQLVTGHPDITPVHGGGTSFWIGNNPDSRGVWNTAGGMLSARLGAEATELAQELGVDEEDSRDQARAIGSALYERSFEWIADNPGDWVLLEGRKAWLTVGNDQLTQDFDWYGEREMIPWAHRVGVPFGALLALGGLGAWAVFRRREGRAAYGAQYGVGLDAKDRRGLAVLLGGLVAATLAANLMFFTSAQHRLPLVVPFAALAGPGLWALREAWRSRRFVVLAVTALVALQGFWPRTKNREPHPVHYYNLGVVNDSIGEPIAALRAFERAVELRPQHPLFHLRRGHLRFRLGELDGAEEDFDFVLYSESAPDWAKLDALKSRQSVIWTKKNVFFIPAGMGARRLQEEEARKRESQ